MNDRLLVLIHGTTFPASHWAPVQASLPHTFRVLTPTLPGAERGAATPFDLERAAEAIAEAIEGSAHPTAAVCGVGLGAMVGLTLAAQYPERVSKLALVTRQVRLSPVLMSLPAAALRLIPARSLRRIGIDNGQLVSLLDQVRPVDFAHLAPGVRPAAAVVCGQQDVINRRTSAALARALPRGELQLVPAAGPNWLTDSPDLLAAALIRTFASPE